MAYFPLNYDKINVTASAYTPSSIKARNNKSFDFWQRALYQRVSSVLEFDFIPEWSGTTKDFIIYCLLRFGYGIVADDDNFGIIFQPCNLKGYDLYYQPTDALVSNPLLSKEYTIGTDCELLKLSPDFMGVFDIIDYYAEKLSLLDNAINMSLVNGKFAWFLGAKNKGAAQALKKMMDIVNKGEPLVIADQRIMNDAQSKDSPFQFLDFGNIKDKYLTTMQLQDFATILNNFDTEIGIPTLPYQKSERLVVSEAESKQVESMARATVWVESLTNSFERINKMFNTNMSVKLRFIDAEKGADEDGDNVVDSI